MRRLPFDRTTLIFLIFILIIAGLFGYNYFFQNQPAQSFTLAVNPLAEDWLRDAAVRFNDSTPIVGTTRVAITITTVDDYDVWNGNTGWGPRDHPIGWLPSSSAALGYIPQSLPFELETASTARTPLVWGGFADRVEVITQAGQRPFDWEAVQQTTAALRWSELGVSGGNINMAILNVESATGGLGALLTAFADYADMTTPDPALINDAAFMEWYQPLVDSLLNSQRISTGGDPAATMAARGNTFADFALLPEVQWLGSLDTLSEAGFTFNYPSYQFVLDFPLVLWQDAQTTDLERGTVAAFGDFLLRDSAQDLAVSYGLRPVAGEPDVAADLFVQGQAYGIVIEPEYGFVLPAPSRNGATAFIRSLD